MRKVFFTTLILAGLTTALPPKNLAFGQVLNTFMDQSVPCVDGNTLIFVGTKKAFTCMSTTSGGTVTSVSVGNLAPLFTAAVGTATTTPAITFTLTNQSANQIYAGPASGAAAAPTFRALVGDDLPNPSAITLGGIESDTCGVGDFINTISTSGVPGCATPSASGVTLQTNTVNNSSQTTLNLTSSAATNGLTLTQSNTSGGIVQLGLSGVLTVPGGGFGLGTLSAHELYVGNGTSNPNPVGSGSAGQVLESNGASLDPTFQDPIVSGPDVVGATPTKNPVQMGCVFLTTPATLTNNQVGAAQCDTGQRLIVTGAGGTFPVTGTFWQATQPVSGTFWQATQPVSGTVTANVGTPGGLALDGTLTGGTAKTQMYDGTNVIGSSTHPVQVSLANTAANSTAVKVDGSAVTQPVSGTFWQATQPVSGTVTANQGGTWTVQPGNTANTTAWKVDGSAVTQPVSGTFWQATQPVSGTFWQATQPVSGTVTTTPPANASTNVVQIGGTAVVADPCQEAAGSFAAFSATANATIITGTSSKQTYICSFNIVTATTQNIALVEGTGTACVTTVNAGLAGGTTAATGWNFAANGGLAFGNGRAWVFKTSTAADNICLLTSSTGQISGSARYVQQ